MRLRPTPRVPPRNPGPINAEAHSLPTDDRVAVHQVQGLSPRGPDSGKNDPKQSVFPLQSRHSLPSLEHSQLLSQSQVFQGQVTALSKGCPNQNSQPSQSLDHGLECGGNRLNNQYLSSLWSFGEAQDFPAATAKESMETNSLTSVPWADITPMARQSWILWITTAKHPETCTCRIENA